VGEGGVAAGKKNAKRLNIHLVFLDESGLLMAPHLRRTWAPIGTTPILYQRTRSREKVSMIAAMTLSPQRHRLGLYFSLLRNENVTVDPLISFLRELKVHLPRGFVLLWDRLAGHRAIRMREFLERQSRIQFEFFPPYAPELNPVEGVWGYLKMNPLANLAPYDTIELSRRARSSTQRLQGNPRLLRSFLHRTGLSFFS
jgi:transposase